MALRNFLEDTILKCIDNDISFKLLPQDQLDGASGSFDGDNKELCSIIDREDWLSILVHESCHMDQFLEEDPLWINPIVNFDIFNSELLKYVDKEFILKAYKAWAELEIDCDKRAVKKIKEYNLIEINIPSYIRQANCYHQAYYYFHKYHIFYDMENPPYNNEELIETFSDKKILDLDEIWVEHPQLEKFLVQNNNKL